MLLIPIAQEQNTVRRMPWVSWTIIALNFAVFLLVALAWDPAPRAQAMEERGRAIYEYLAAHPYLDVPAEIVDLIADEFLERLSEAKAEYEREDALPEAPVLRSEQAELESRVQAFLDALHSGPIHTFGFKPAERRPITWLTTLFMHSGWLHILGNMLFFFLAGPFIEDLYGRALFCVLYVLSGVAATAAYAVHQPDSMIPLVGASGAIAGIMGAFLIRLATARIRFLFLPLGLPIVRIPLVLPAFVVLPLWFGEQVWYAQRAPGASGVAWWAHIGGFAFGVGAALLIKLSRVEESWIHGAIERKISIEQHPGLERAVDARVRSELKLAEQEIRAVLAAEPANIDAWSEAYEIALARGDGAESGRRAGRVLDLLVKAKETDLAMDLVLQAPERCPRPLDARFCLAAASFLEKQDDGREALAYYQRVIDQAPQDAAAFRALFRQAEVLRRGGDRRAARSAYERARAHAACTDAWPQTIDSALATLGRPEGR